MASESSDSPHYKMLFSRQAEKYIDGLQKKDAKIIAVVLQKLARAPRDNAQKLKQNPSFWRVRAGNHRVVYVIFDDRRLIFVALIRDRKDAYRDLDKLDPETVLRTIATRLAGTRPR